MRAEDSELQALRRHLRAFGKNAAPRADCPAPERIWAAVHRQLEPKALREVIDHVASCLVCAEAWELAEELRPGRASPAYFFAYLHRSHFVRIAAGLVLVVGLGLILHNPSTTDRGGGESGIQVLVEGPLSRDDCTLRWEGPPGATGYDVEVIWTHDPSVVLAEQRNLREGRLTVPSWKLEGIPPGENIFWSIQPLKDGRPWGERLTHPTRLE